MFSEDEILAISQNEDAYTIKTILPKFLKKDTSLTRPEGNMEVLKVIWWEHNCKSGLYSSSKAHRSSNVPANGSFNDDKLKKSLPDLVPKIIDGF